MSTFVIYNFLPVVVSIIKSRMRWAERVARGEMRNANSVPVESLKESDHSEDKAYVQG